MSPSIPPWTASFHAMTPGPAFDASPVPQALLDEAWQVVHANRAWIAAIGDDPAGRPWMDLVHADDIARDLPAIGRIQGGDAAPLRSAVKLARTDGSSLAAAIEATPLGADGVLVTIMPGALAAPSADEAGDRRVVASALSHDVRQHARLTSAYASLLARSQLNERQTGHLAIITDHAERLQHILGELVRWLRLPDEPLDIGACDLNLMWAEATADLDADVSSSGLEVVRGDRVLLAVLLAELADNAARYRGGRATIRLDLQRSGDAWELTVSDDGPGIPEEQRRRVLLPLHRLHTWEQAHGHGMGLALATRIAVRHGGDLRIGSAEAGGCAVHVRIPA